MKNSSLPRYLCAPLLIAVFAVSSIFAQPGDELERARLEAASLKTEIAVVSFQLAKGSKSAELWEKRGDLYVRLYKTVFANTNLRDKLAADLNEVDLVSKIIVDYTHVVWLNNKTSEVFLKRGTAYALRWYLTTRIDWAKATRGNRDPKWNDIVDWEDRARQRAVFTKFITNPDFDLATNDLDRSSRGRNDVAVEVAAEWAMGKLYLERPRGLPYGQSEFLRELGENGMTGYKVWDDYDPAIHHLADAEWQQMKYGPLQVLVLPLEFSKATYRDALFEKIQLAIAYGRDKDAVGIRRYHSVWIRAQPPNDPFACRYYTEIYRAEVRLGEYDHVIDNFGVILENDPRLDCDSTHEPRGDAYLAKGEYAKAIADYTIAAKDSTTSTPRIYVNRAKAYLKLGEKQKAIADLNHYLSQSSGGHATPEDHLLRASILRELGDLEKATEDEKTARDLKLTSDTNAENGKRPGLIYGTVLMPTGKSIAVSDTVQVTLNYADGTKEHSASSIDQRGRFVFRYLKLQPFYITAELNGGLGSFQVRTRRFPITRSHIGPIRIKLAEKARR